MAFVCIRTEEDHESISECRMLSNCTRNRYLQTKHLSNRGANSDGEEINVVRQQRLNEKQRTEYTEHRSSPNGPPHVPDSFDLR